MCRVSSRRAAAVPARFVIDARAIRAASGASLAERPTVDTSVGGAASPVGTGTGGGSATLGQGCFGKVTSMTYIGAPVAVKELSAASLDAASIGEPTPSRSLTADASDRRRARVVTAHQQ